MTMIECGLRHKGRVRLKRNTRVRLKRNTRVHLKWRPDWWSSIHGWTINYLTANKWRCDPIYEFDDLMQDAYLVFEKVVACYPRCIEPKHFMALFKTALRNAIFDKSRAERNRINHMTYLDEGDVSEIAETFWEHSNYGPLAAAIAKAPVELRLTIKALSDETSVVKLREPSRAYRGEPRGNLNDRLSKLAGLDQRYNVVGALKELLSN